MKIAFQGETGAYSEQAVIEFFGEGTDTLPCVSFEQVFQTTSQEKSTHGMIPIENSLAGSIHRNYDLMLRNDLQIVGEYHLRVHHCLLGLPEAKLSDIREVHSHPQALAQCESSLNELQVKQIAEADTAGSARKILELKNPHAGALASQRAANVYKLKILKEGMEDNPANYTRFLVLSCESEAEIKEINGEYKTSVVFSLRNHPGALFKALSVFALRDIDLTKIESRPIAGKPWEYLFYIDFLGHSKEYNCSRALEHLQELAPFLRILGSYPRHHMRNQQT